MNEIPQDERIRTVISKMIGREYKPTLIGRFHPFPAKSPSKHESIQTFKADMEGLANFHDGLSSVWNALDELSDAQKIRLNTTAKKAALRMDKLTPEKIAGIEDTLSTLKGIAMLLAHSIKEEGILLEYQKEMFWSGRGRSKNHQAHFVANTLAKIYVEEFKKRHSYGENDGIPSGKYCIALQEIFEILNIEGGFLHFAKAAHKYITDEDIAEAKKNPKRLPFSTFASG